MSQQGEEAETASAIKPWHEAFPAPSSAEVSSMPRHELLGMLRDGAKDFLLVDLRKNDHEGGTIRGSLNLPAQSLYHSLPALFALAERAGIKIVVWYCGSSRGRGTRAAAWFQDEIASHGGVDKDGMRSVTLQGGIKGWATAGPEYEAMMEGFDGAVWRRVSAAADG